MVSIIVAPASRGFAEDVPALRDGVRRYTCRTFKQDFSPHKHEARERIRKLVLENEAFAPAADGRIVHALTLPGPWWHFENGLSKQKHFYFTGVEGEESLFRLATMRMPNGATSEDAQRFYSTYQHKRLLCPVVRGLRHKLLRCDVHAYLRAMLMEMGGVENRLDFIGDVSRSILGRDWHEVSRFRYSDGAPMAQFVFQRKESARKVRTPRAVVRLSESIRESYADLPPYTDKGEVRFE